MRPSILVSLILLNSPLAFAGPVESCSQSGGMAGLSFISGSISKEEAIQALAPEKKYGTVQAITSLPWGKFSGSFAVAIEVGKPKQEMRYAAVGILRKSGGEIEVLAKTATPIELGTNHFLRRIDAEPFDIGKNGWAVNVHTCHLRRGLDVEAREEYANLLYYKKQKKELSPVLKTEIKEVQHPQIPNQPVVVWSAELKAKQGDRFYFDIRKRIVEPWVAKNSEATFRWQEGIYVLQGKDPLVPKE